MTTILHVEDDSMLAEMVRIAFETFGFGGVALIAETVNRARAIISDVGRYEDLDLVLTDMRLPDGSGLDVVRCVRDIPAREHVPVLVLSDDGDPDQVDRAYALGANAYVSKASRGRPTNEVVKALYDHWLRDALLPRVTASDRTRRLVARAVRLQKRLASIFMRITEQRHVDPAEGEFWMSLALSRGNFANLLTFLGRQLGERALPGELLDHAEGAQLDGSRIVAKIEHELDAGAIRTQDDECRLLLAVASIFHVQPADRVVSELFPSAPVALAALRRLFAQHLEAIAAWVDTHTGDPVLRERAARLRRDAAYLRAPPGRAGSLVSTPGP